MNAVLRTVFAAVLVQQQVAPPANFRAFDTSNDAGRSVTLTWDRMPYDGSDLEYVALGSTSAEGPWVEVGRAASTGHFAAELDWPFWARPASDDAHLLNVDVSPIIEAQDGELKKLREEERAIEQKIKAAREAKEEHRVTALEIDLKLARERSDSRLLAVASGNLYFKLQVVRAGQVLAQTAVMSATAGGNWFDWRKLNNFLFTVAFCAVILVFIGLAKRRKLFLRQIPGLAAIDEALGRATEMGKPVYYMTGREDFTKVSTIAAVSILGEVAKKCAKFGTELKVPHTLAIVYAVSEEVTRQAYTQVGRPDAYRPGTNFYVTDDQFGYTAAVDGMMVREKPAAVIYMGYYYAESLVLAETGASIGAIQIAGTDADHQLPFFVTACDYTLIGEELYAAGAYLSGDPNLVGTLRGQDIGKALIIGFALLGTVVSLVLTLAGRPELLDKILQVFKAY